MPLGERALCICFALVALLVQAQSAPQSFPKPAMEGPATRETARKKAIGEAKLFWNHSKGDADSLAHSNSTNAVSARRKRCTGWEASARKDRFASSKPA